MDYKIVTLQEKTIVGVSAKTSNEDPKMGNIIGGLWSKLYQENVVSQIKNRVNESRIGLYSDYDQDGYTVTVGCEVLKTAVHDLDTTDQELNVKCIPAGKYAKFEIHGDVQKSVAAAWEEIWKTELNRTYTSDFEEYVDNDMEHATIYIYVAIQ